MRTIPVSEEVFLDVSRRAEERGISPEEWASSVLSQRLRLEQQAEEYLRLRAARASSKPLGELLDKAPNRPPDPGDEFEA